MPHAEPRTLALLEGLFELDPMPVDTVLSRCADLIGQATGCEKVDAFVHDPTSNTLVAVGTSRTELGQLQKSLGLDRLPIVNGDPMSIVYQTGEPYLLGQIDRDDRQPKGIVDDMGVRSMLAVPYDVGVIRRGVISLASRRTDAFTNDDLVLMKMVAVWVGGLVHRSELIAAQSAAAEAQGRRAAAEEIIIVLAHDLRNMLSPIVSRLHILLARANEAGRTEDAGECSRVLLGVNRLNELMSDLLDVARIDQGLLSLKVENVELVALLKKLAQTLSLPEVEIRIESYVAELPILADRKRLSQALENVLSNATKHSPRGASVSVELAPAKLQTGEAARITIADRGPGIAPDMLPRIFERYVSAGPSSGLGLGLYLTRAVISAHGGTITMTSNASQGTRCEMLLPRAFVSNG